jgi:hypothetical protein
MVQIRGTMDVFEKISELSQFQSSPFSASIFEFKYSINQDSRPSVNSEEPPFLEEDLPDLHTSLTQSFLADCRSFARKAATPALLTLAFACHPIRNDLKQNHFPSNCYLSSVPEPNLTLSSKAQSASSWPSKNSHRAVLQWP